MPDARVTPACRNVAAGSFVIADRFYSHYPVAMRDAIKDPTVEEFSAGVRAVLGAELVAIYWFGSRARGRGMPDSDYDFLIETKGRLSEQERDGVTDIAVDLSADRGVLLDIHYRTSETIVRDATRSPFIEAVLKEGVAA